MTRAAATDDPTREAGARDPRAKRLTAQGVADGLTLLACSCATTEWTLSLLACAGGLAFCAAIVAVPLVLCGALYPTTAVGACFFSSLVSCLARFRALTQPAPDKGGQLTRAVDALSFVPEAWARWLLLEANSSLCWEGGEAGAPRALFVGSVPSPAAIRALVKDQRAKGVEVLVLNVCEWWCGWGAACDELGLSHKHLPSARVYSLDVVEELKRRLLAPCDKSRTVLLHCESGARACAIAAAFLAVAGPLDAAAATAAVVGATKGRASCVDEQCVRCAELALTALGVRKKGKAATRPVSSARPAAPSTAPAAPAHVSGGEVEEEEEDDDDEEEAERVRAEQAARRATYMQAVARHGLPKPGAAPPVVTASGGGWATVGAAKPKAPGGGVSYAQQVANAGNASLLPASVQAKVGHGAAAGGAAAGDGLTKKQRENRRKAEKAKADREFFRQAALSKPITGPTL